MTKGEAAAYVQAMSACVIAESFSLSIMAMANPDQSERERIAREIGELPVRYGIHHNAVIGLLQEAT